MLLQIRLWLLPDIFWIAQLPKLQHFSSIFDFYEFVIEIIYDMVFWVSNFKGR